MTDEERGNGMPSSKSSAPSSNPNDPSSRSKSESASTQKASELSRPASAAPRSPPPTPEGAWAMRASESDFATQARAAEATESMYYGASDPRARRVGGLARDAAFDSLREAKNHAIDSISEGVSEIGDRTKRAGRGMVDFVGTHAIPLALLGAGIGWLLADMSKKRTAPRPSQPNVHEGAADSLRQRSTELASRASNALHEGRDRLVHGAHDVQVQVTDRVKELSGQVMKTASHMSDQAATYGRQAYGAVERAGTRALKLSGENPFVTGLMAMVLGATAGLLLPTTRRENRLMGETRDHLLEAAQRSATELKETAQHGVEELKSAVAPALQPST